MVWSGSSSGAAGSWVDGILLHGAASQDSHTDVNVIYEESSTHDGIVVFASASSSLQYVLWRSGSWQSRESSSWTNGIGTIVPPAGVTNCNIAFTDVAAEPEKSNILIGVTCGTYGWTVRWASPDFDNKILHATDLVGGDHLALSVAYEKASFLFNTPLGAHALVVFSRANLNNVYFRRLGFNGAAITDSTDIYGLSTDCPADPGGCKGPLLDNVPNTLRLSADTATKDMALMVQDDDNDIYFVRFDGQFSVSKILSIQLMCICCIGGDEERQALPARVIRAGCLDSFHITRPNSHYQSYALFLSLLCCLNNRTDLFTISSGELF